MIKEEEARYVKIPKYYNFNSVAEREAHLSANYFKIVTDIDNMIKCMDPELFKSKK